MDFLFWAVVALCVVAVFLIGIAVWTLATLLEHKAMLDDLGVVLDDDDI
jgi:hypothetical protein